VLWGTTAFGVIHVFTEYKIMTYFSRWDSPPGLGYLTAAVITLSAILTVIMTLRTPRSGADDKPHQDHRSGSLTPPEGRSLRYWLEDTLSGLGR
jgi:hypothetical protein